MKKILAISGSLRNGSSNYAILRYLQQQVTDSVSYHIYDLLGDIPPFDPDNDLEPVNATIAETRLQIADADGIIICTPEYAFGVPGVLKNMLDWLVSSSSLVDKPVMLVTASLGGEYAHASLLLTLGALSANVIADASFIIPFVRSKINSNGDITDAETSALLDNAFRIFQQKL